MKVLLEELELEAVVTHYAPAGVGSAGGNHGYSFGPPDPEELEFVVYLDPEMIRPTPDGRYELLLNSEQWACVERQIRRGS